MFGTPQNISAASAGIAPVSVALADVNSDSKLDLITPNAASGSVPNSVSVLPGNGDGTFGGAQRYALTAPPTCIAVADLNGDSKPDIIVGVVGAGGAINVLLNNGDGTFAPAVSYDSLTNVHALAVGDFDRDGHPDIAAVGDDANPANNVAILWGSANGTFTGPDFVSVPHEFLSGVAAFATGPIFSLAVSDQQDSLVTVLPATGNRSSPFGTSVDYHVGTGPASIGTSDFNGDGIADLVTANSTGGSVTVLTGRGDRTFNITPINSAVTGVPAGGGPVQVLVSNFDSAPTPDLLVLLGPGSAGDAAVLLGNGNGTFHTGTLIATGGAARTGIAAGDLNGDGFTDVVLSDPSTVSAVLNITNQDTTPPTASVDATQAAPVPGSTIYPFTVTYADNTQIDASTLGDGNLVVQDPLGHTQAAKLVSMNVGNGPTVTAIYQITAPSGALSSADNGTYTVIANANSVKDANGNALAAGTIGTFTLNVPAGNGPNLTASDITTTIPTSVVAGSHSKGSAKLTITNTGQTAIKQAILIGLYASPDGHVGSDTPLLTSVTKRINLKPGRHISVSFPHFVWTSGLNGYYLLAAKVDVNNALSEANEADNVAVSTGKTFAVAPPFVDLQNLSTTAVSTTLVTGKPLTVTLTLKNLGNITALGAATIKVLASADATESADDVTLATLTPRLSIRAGQTKLIRLHFKAPVLAAGAYHLITDAALTGDSNPANNTSATSGAVTV